MPTIDRITIRNARLEAEYRDTIEGRWSTVFVDKLTAHEVATVNEIVQAAHARSERDAAIKRLSALDKERAGLLAKIGGPDA